MDGPVTAVLALFSPLGEIARECGGRAKDPCQHSCFHAPASFGGSRLALYLKPQLATLYVAIGLGRPSIRSDNGSELASLHSISVG